MLHGIDESKRSDGQDIALAARLKVMRQEEGLEEATQPTPPPEPKKPISTLRQDQSTFDSWVEITKATRPGTIEFYKTNYQKLLEYAPLGRCATRSDR